MHERNMRGPMPRLPAAAVSAARCERRRRVGTATAGRCATLFAVGGGERVDPRQMVVIVVIPRMEARPEEAQPFAGDAREQPRRGPYRNAIIRSMPRT